MTFREKLAKEHPEYADETEVGGCKGCPSDYWYEIEPKHCPCNGDCRKCWDREIPKTYEDGLNDAWELAKKIAMEKSNGGFDVSEIVDIFGFNDMDAIFMYYTPQEALAKLKAYEEEIKVGDVVQICGLKKTYVVTAIDTDGGNKYYCGIGEKGTWFFQRDVVKTGKHIDIEVILGQIRGE